MNTEVTLEFLIEKYGTDKILCRYGDVYTNIFTPIRYDVKSILEIGIGTLDPSIPSTFVGNPSHYPQYKQGGSLRVWRDFFTNAQVYGVDIAEDCMFTEERIQTFLFDSSISSYCNHYLKDLTFDIIIDDGNHSPKYQLSTLKNLLPKLNPGGIYVIEDIGGYDGSDGLFEDYQEEFKKVWDGYDVYHRGNIIVITDTKNQNIQDNIETSKTVTMNQHVIDMTESRKFKQNFTIVSGLWNLSRNGRDFDSHYIPRFKEFLNIDAPMILFLPEELHDIVWEVRKRSNTFIKTFELSDIKSLYSPHWDNTQKVRTNEKWLNITGEGGWLKGSPQATLEYYNPIVQSKMFMLHDAVAYSIFDTDYFYWLDAGITNTVPATHLVQDRALDNLVKYTDPFIFLSYPYEGAGEIHGFEQKAIDTYAKEPVKYVCRGGLFGGHKEQIKEANAVYYSLLHSTLSSGYMGTEESIFSIMAHLEPYNYRRFMLDGNGLIVKFTEALIKDSVELVELKTPKPKVVTNKIIDLTKYKTNLYILTFNFPEQLLHTIESMKKVPEWLEKPRLILLDNSTNDDARTRYQEIASEYNFEYISLGENKGICGGRQFAAEHFHDSDADFYFFFEDDMTSNSKEEEGNFCRNGLRKYIPRLYDIVHKIMIKEEFDYLKLSFTEVYWDNNIQTSWYNVPQEIRTKFWPDYDRLPVTGRDPNAPRTKFSRIDNMDGVAYITGDVTYTNWPMIMSRKGNEKVFIETKWAHPYEQTWMSHVFQKQKEGEVNAAILLASPIWHDRIKHYTPEERREN
jgi:hypothetical protein